MPEKTDKYQLFDYTKPYPNIMGAPEELEISITGKCNLQCRYCYYAENMQQATDVDTQTWKDFFTEAGACGVRKITISGGECFLRDDLFELLDSIIANKMRYSIITNGTLLTEEKIQQLAGGQLRSRLDSIQFSIDGSCAEIHDKSRPRHSFARAIKNLREMHAQKFPVTVRVTINKYNYNDLENIAALLLDEIGLSFITTNEAEIMGSARCHGEQILLTATEREIVSHTFAKLQQKYSGKINSASGPHTRLQQFTKIANALADGATSFGYGNLSACGSVFRKMAVLHDGSLVPCNMLPEMIMGKIGTHSLKEVWRSHPCINLLRYRRNIPLTAIEFCKDCAYTGFCTGGCPASVKAKTGNFYDIDPLYCYRNYLGETLTHERIEK